MIAHFQRRMEKICPIIFHAAGFKTQGDSRRWLSDCLHVATSSSARYVPWVWATYEFVQGAPRPMKMGTTRSPFPYDGCRSPPRAPIGKAAIPYDFVLRLADAAFDFGRVVCLPFDSGLSINRDGHKAGSVIPTHDHLVVHLIENGAVEPYSLLRYRAGSDGSCR